ncbi:MAG: Rpn family recombination-promoting nuclease/putative transposase [Haliscomenobacter sp.]|uniref:Rpn family recombination-promoting nuclease/putative transposase n=1 Tax=Haliscomenobacter sp. TaxID=2717303 RepID=UPI0029B0FCE3|nr:Rpn family recombination-promoting nuclease/putative transposase [Haliscomenobacter sp.]MDX2070756.1 Rpn family recombination-promoting nuclease/putative transposase [Haliscomenobacter sp.]
MAEPLFINPFTDFGFKKIFGEEQNKDLLIDFLNELLATQNQHISDLVFKKNDRLGSDDLDRKVVFDLYCENEQGEKFTVELQKAKQAFFKDRMLYYSSFSVQEQGQKGDWDYQLKAIYVIAILDFIMDEDNSDKIVVSKNKMMDIERYKVFYDKLTFVTLQMPNFAKEEHELESNFDKWLYVIKNLHKLDHIPERIQERVFQKLFKVASYTALSKEEKFKYEDSLKYYNDLKNSLDTAQQEGYQEARAEYEVKLEEEQKRTEQEKQRAEQERILKEEALATLENERKNFLQSVLNVQNMGLDKVQIAQITNRSIEEIEVLLGQE